ncbi:hypothetical protein CJ030_MR1G004792 [Morella rubra]|uniref:F-box protein n=1 Tax=Morella rubra TaxID=262757 RepID=A0A6A1WJ52_9ROSI|nr:hypothetical protein CJ030_MR1G004792 [Morella rubra]
MASLQASPLLLSSSLPSSNKINAAILVPKLPRVPFSVPNIPTRKQVEELCIKDGYLKNTVRPLEKSIPSRPIDVKSRNSTGIADAKLHAILETVGDRVEMHTNVGEQRDNWNTLFLNSVNMITLTASIMAGVAAIGGAGVPLLALKLSSGLLYSAATGMLLIMNKIQPSQLAEEQRSAARLFRQLESQIKTMLALRSPTEEDVKNVMDNILAVDKAYPLPLIGTMLEKFPATFEPAVWWPANQFRDTRKSNEGKQSYRKTEENGWSEDLDVEMRNVIEVVKSKDMEDYQRLGNLVLKINKILAISGPLLTGIAAIGSAFMGSGSWAAIVAVTAGALATTVSAFEHGGQVGMVVEMYRNNAGFFRQLEESIQGTLEEKDFEKRENGKLFEMKVALQLGRSLSQLKELARKSANSHIHGIDIDEFASKLF